MKQLLRSIRTQIIIGAVLVTPLAVSMWVILAVVNLLSASKLGRWLSTPIMERLPAGNWTGVEALVSLVTVLALFFCIGLLFRNFVGRKAYGFLDRVMEKTPGFNKVYTFVRTVSESIVAQKETMFQEVVLIEHPRPGMYAIAFVSASATPAIQAATGEPAEPHVYVFLPTTPNPTSGFLLLLPRRDVKPLAMSPSEAMRLVVSAGASAPADPASGRSPSLLEKLELLFAKKGIPTQVPGPKT